MGTTVGNVLISYDVDEKQQQVKAALSALGYFDYFTLAGNGPYLLPETTLWAPGKSSNTAMRDMQNVCTTLQVRLTRAVAVLADEFVGI